MDLYFDYISPYAYLAWRALDTAQLPRRPTPVPVLFAGLLNASGGVGPAEVEPKRRYVFRDVARRARDVDLAFCAPPSHPFNPLLALRVTCAALRVGPADALISALFDAVWATGCGAETQDQVRRALTGLELDVDGLLAAATLPETKAQLRANTDRAIDRGVFGVPTMVVDQELFWGADSLGHLRAHLLGAPPLPEPQLRAWDALGATAKR